MKRLTQAALKEVLDYDEQTGVFTWKPRPAGYKHHHGYTYIKVFGQDYAAHRLAWFWVHGVFPESKDVDHVNGVRDDNRLVNLRPATRSENTHNQFKAHRQSKSGVLGVSRYRKRWLAQINLNGKRIYLGVHETVEAAQAAYLKAKKDLHPTAEVAK